MQHDNFVVATAGIMKRHFALRVTATNRRAVFVAKLTSLYATKKKQNENSPVSKRRV